MWACSQGPKNASEAEQDGCKAGGAQVRWGVGSIGELAVAGVVRATPIASVVARLGKFIVWGQSVGTHVGACAWGCTNGVGVQVAGVWCAWLGICACGC